jgi:uncharacterized OsmC-like protein
VTHRTRTSGDQHNLAGEGIGMQPLGSVFGHCQGAVRGHGRYAEARADVKAGVSRKAYHSSRGQVCVFLRGAGGPLVAGEVNPDPIADGKVLNTVTDCVNDTCTVLVRSHLREGRRCTGTGANPGLPVRGVDAGCDDADTDLARRWFDHIAIDKTKDRRVTSLRVDDRPHARENLVIFRIIPAPANERVGNQGRRREGCPSSVAAVMVHQSNGVPFMTTATVQRPPRNGVDVPALFATLDAVKGAPQIAQFQFRATNEWISGTHNRSSIQGFYGAGQEDASRPVPFSYDADHPAVLVGTNHGPTPVEFLLHAIAACITAGVANIAAARGITLRRVTSTVEGDIDLLGILGLSDVVRNGYRQIRVHFDVDGDASPEQLRALIEQSRRRSAVYDVLVSGTDVQIDVTTP